MIKKAKDLEVGDRILYKGVIRAILEKIDGPELSVLIQGFDSNQTHVYPNGETLVYVRTIPGNPK